MFSTLLALFISQIDNPVDLCIRSNSDTQLIDYINLWYQLDDTMTLYYINDRSVLSIDVKPPSEDTNALKLFSYGGIYQLVVNNSTHILDDRVLGTVVNSQDYLFTPECKDLIGDWL